MICLSLPVLCVLRTVLTLTPSLRIVLSFPVHVTILSYYLYYYACYRFLRCLSLCTCTCCVMIFLSDHSSSRHHWRHAATCAAYSVEYTTACHPWSVHRIVHEKPRSKPTSITPLTSDIDVVEPRSDHRSLRSLDDIKCSCPDH